MLSRTADSLYWLARYVERAENTARLIDAAQRLSAVPQAELVTNEWESAVLATGTLDAFKRQNLEPTREAVLQYLSLSPANSSSIRSCLEVARANARAVRTALTAEMWETINDAWLRLRTFNSRSLDGDHLADFLGFVKQVSLAFDGSGYRTMLRNDAYFFSRIGVYIERADATSRILDVKYHVLLPPGAAVGGSLDYFQWSSILRSVSALTAYRWVYRESLKPWLVADLLILRQEMPRSLASCYENLVRYLDLLARAYGQQGNSQRVARATFTKLANSNVTDVFQSGVHEFITEFIGENNRLGSAIAQQYLV